MARRTERATRLPAVREVRCRTILGESGICDFALNCYTGCAHGCAYCYARFMGRFHHPGEPWGSFVDAKVNAVQVLARQLRRRSLFGPPSVFVSSVCDPYQPAERAYQLTRQCLGMLLDAGFQVHVQTKNDLVQRDFDLLDGRSNVSVCQTISTMDEPLAAALEPRASPPSARVEALRQARRAGIPTKAFVGPVLPRLSDTAASLQAVFAELAGLGLTEVYVDRLNRRWGVWPALRTLLWRIAPDAVGPTRAVLFNEAERQAYSRQLTRRVRRAARAAGLTAPLTLGF